jgi:hypothetical protein
VFIVDASIATESWHRTSYPNEGHYPRSQTGNTILKGRGYQKDLFAKDRRIGKRSEQKCRVGEYCAS